MIVIVSDNMGVTIAKYRGRIKGLSRCRLRGTMDGKGVKLVSRSLMKATLTGSNPDEIICDGFEPTKSESRLIKKLLKEKDPDED